jgi:hypothetical protein
VAGHTFFSEFKVLNFEKTARLQNRPEKFFRRKEMTTTLGMVHKFDFVYFVVGAGSSFKDSQGVLIGDDKPNIKGPYTDLAAAQRDFDISADLIITMRNLDFTGNYRCSTRVPEINPYGEWAEVIASAYCADHCEDFWSFFGQVDLIKVPRKMALMLFLLVNAGLVPRPTPQKPGNK